MIAPPGRPKMVVTPSSTSDWHMALAPFKRIDVLISVERTIALPDRQKNPGEQKNPTPYKGEVFKTRGTTLFCALSAISSATPARPNSPHPSSPRGRGTDFGSFSRTAQRRVREPVLRRAFTRCRLSDRRTRAPYCSSSTPYCLQLLGRTIHGSRSFSQPPELGSLQWGDEAQH